MHSMCERKKYICINFGLAGLAGQRTVVVQWRNTLHTAEERRIPGSTSGRTTRLAAFKKRRNSAAIYKDFFIVTAPSDSVVS
jgi:hypothetical protein